VSITAEQARTAVARVFGRPVHDCTVSANPYASSFELADLDVAFEDGERVRLVVKACGRSGLLPEAKAAKAASVLDPWREILTYSEILEPLALAAPAYHGALIDPDLGTFWLLIEAVEGVPLWQLSGDDGAWEAAASWLALLHRSAPARAHHHLLRYDSNWFERLFHHTLSQGAGTALRRVIGRWGGVVERLAALPQTFVHGDFYPSNVLVEGEGACALIRPVDWELAGCGPLLLDLAALTAGWPSADRQRLAAAYRRELPSRLVLGELEFAEGLACCRLAIALQWLGSAPGWQAPRAHAADWLSEALAAAEELDL
jgi:aminoglycoside phosphotransferase (APT) family kinase protein